MSRASLALAGLALMLVAVVPAEAAGTGGIEVSPYPGVVDGHQVTAFHVAAPSSGTTTVRYSIRNTTDAPVTGRIYAASAASDGHGGWTVGGAGSARRVDLDDQQVTLAPHEIRLAAFDVRGEGVDEEALVVEVHKGAVVARAATLVYLREGRRVPLPLLVVSLAFLALLGAGAGVALSRRRSHPIG